MWGISIFHRWGNSTFHARGKILFNVWGKFTCHLHHSYDTNFINGIEALGEYKRNIDTFIKNFNYPYTDQYIEDMFNMLNYKEKTEKILEHYDDNYSCEYYKIAHYFRHLYYIFKYIDTDKKLKDEDKTKYAKIFRAQLSHDEMILIGINGMTEYGEKFKDYIEKYSLLHRLLNADKYRAIFIYNYSEKAFGNEDLTRPLPENDEVYEKYYKPLLNKL